MDSFNKFRKFCDVCDRKTEHEEIQTEYKDVIFCCECGIETYKQSDEQAKAESDYIWGLIEAFEGDDLE